MFNQTCPICWKKYTTCQDYCNECWPRVKDKRNKMAETYREQMAKRLENYPAIAKIARKYV